jgi:hypothetical protein
VQADSGDWTPKVNRISRYIKGIYSENEGKGFAEIAVQADAVMPLKLVKGEKFGINIILKDNKALLSFAPIRNFRDTSNPGEFKLVLEMIK